MQIKGDNASGGGVSEGGGSRSPRVARHVRYNILKCQIIGVVTRQAKWHKGTHAKWHKGTQAKATVHCYNNGYIYTDTPKENGDGTFSKKV